MCQEIASPSRSGSVARISRRRSSPRLAISRRRFSAAAVDLPDHREVLRRAAPSRPSPAGRGHGRRWRAPVVRAEILVDRLGLGRRFDDDDVSSRHCLSLADCLRTALGRSRSQRRQASSATRLPGWRSRRPASSSSSRTVCTTAAVTVGTGGPASSTAQRARATGSSSDRSASAAVRRSSLAIAGASNSAGRARGSAARAAMPPRLVEHVVGALDQGAPWRIRSLAPRARVERRAGHGQDLAALLAARGAR